MINTNLYVSNCITVIILIFLFRNLLYFLALLTLCISFQVSKNTSFSFLANFQLNGRSLTTYFPRILIKPNNPISWFTQWHCSNDFSRSSLKSVCFHVIWKISSPAMLGLPAALAVHSACYSFLLLESLSSLHHSPEACGFYRHEVLSQLFFLQSLFSCLVHVCTSWYSICLAWHRNETLSCAFCSLVYNQY